MADQTEQDRRDTKKCYYQMMGQAHRHTAHPKKLPPTTYIVRELSMNPHLLAPDADIRTYRAYVDVNGHCLEDPDPPKCPVRAAELRQEGNELYRRKLLDGALLKYNESLCAAPNGSEELGMGYANRSAVFYEKGLFGVALVNADLAKKHNYPDRLMAKLLTREANCRQKLEEIEDKDREDGIPSSLTGMEPNPRIPFLANGIDARQHPIHGPIMVADRDFRAGDVILREKPMVACVSGETVFGRCNHCVSRNLLHLIPCPNCASAMFCSEECLREGQKVHRFECGICTATSKQNDFCMGPRLFFHGLSLFNDDVTKMMEFCGEVRGSESSFFELDYSNYDPVAEFRAFLTAKHRRPEQPLYDNILHFNSAIFFALYMKVPLVQRLIATEEHQDFMQQCFVDYQILRRASTILQTEHGHIYPIGSIFGHSCDPNTIALETGNELRLIAQRPIRQGDQIHFSYGPMYDQGPDLHEYFWHGLGFACTCDFCDQEQHSAWMAKVRQPPVFDPADWDAVQEAARSKELSAVEKMDTVQRFIQRFGYSHPQEDYAKKVQLYAKGLEVFHKREIRLATLRMICG